MLVFAKRIFLNMTKRSPDKHELDPKPLQSVTRQVTNITFRIFKYLEACIIQTHTEHVTTMNLRFKVIIPQNKTFHVVFGTLLRSYFLE